MKLNSIFIFIMTAASIARAEPAIEMPHEEPHDESTSKKPESYTLNDLVGGGRRLGIGGYGEAEAILDGDDKQVKLRRFVLFAGYRFTDWARLYSELEVENGNVIELEQAYLELEPRRWLGFRAGLLIVPVGLHNLYHEPPTFNPVERPLTDQLVIPSTWRELGVGIYGSPVEGLHYQLYAMSGLDADKFQDGAPLVGGRGNGQAAHLNDAAISGRLNYNRVLGLDVGAGFYYGGAGQDVKELGGVRVGIIEVDARFRRWGWNARAEYTRVFITGAARLTNYQRETNPTFAAIPKAAEGFYAEVGYNLLRRVRRAGEHELEPFIGYEYVDTHAQSSTGILAPGASTAKHYLDVGIAYHPHPQIVLKFDYRRRLADATPTPSEIPSSDPAPAPKGQDVVAFGIGFMF
jgi:hypothetical protein